ncbi:hypothetical protein TWF506_007149 [Arthrobotrys conoides]|uniref:Uncharacterized protein n=1 Tax=Arthrobotrys conoides TaxID=74498 RepID=A0AAN8NP83_9PEZI
MWRKRTNAKAHWGPCATQQTADRCVVILGCFCVATLTQPTATNRAATVEHYQEAINRIPGAVRQSVKNKFWNWRMHGLDPAPGQTMRWTNDFQDVLNEIADQNAVPYGDTAGSWITEPVPNIETGPYFPDGEGDFTWLAAEGFAYPVEYPGDYWVTEPIPDIESGPYFPPGEEDFNWARHEFGYYGPRYGPGPSGSGSGSGPSGSGSGSGPGPGPVAKRRSVSVDKSTCGVNEGPRQTGGQKPSSTGNESPTKATECGSEADVPDSGTS